MDFLWRFWNCCQIHWNGWYFFYSPVLLFPICSFEPVLEYSSVMLIVWVLDWFLADVPPAAVTAMLPIVFLPVLGILDSNTVCMNYARDSNVLFLCCNFIAVTFIHSNLAQQIAAFVLRYLSCDPQKILLIFMSFSYLMTIFLPAAYVCAFMMPTILAVLKYLDDAAICKAINEDIEIKDDETPYPSAASNAFFIGVAYAVNIGSIAAPFASDSGSTLRALVQSETSLDNLRHLFELKYFASSMTVSLVILIFTIFYLQFIFLGFKPFDKELEKDASDLIKNNLPPFDMHMIWVLSLFILSAFSVIVCSILTPKINNKALKFSVNAMLLCFFLFVLPKNFDFFHYFMCTAPKEYQTVPSVLQWAPTHKLTPWNTFFVHGSSSVFGDVMKTMNLHMFWADGLLTVNSKIVQQMGFMGVTTALTIMGSNQFVSDIMLNMGVKAIEGKSAAALLYPIAWSTCLTFFLPVSSYSNSFALGWGNVRVKDMLLAALGPTLFAWIVIFLMGLIL